MGRWRKGPRSGAGGGEEEAGRRRGGEASAEAARLRKLRGVWEAEAAAREAVVERIRLGKRWAGDVDGRLAAFQRKSSGIVRQADSLTCHTLACERGPLRGRARQRESGVYGTGGGTEAGWGGEDRVAPPPRRSLAAMHDKEPPSVAATSVGAGLWLSLQRNFHI
jgi:hypothetical protein